MANRISIALILFCVLGLNCSVAVAQDANKQTTQAKNQVVDKRKNAEYFSKGLDCKYKGDVKGAIENFEKALEFMPDDAASMFELSEQYIKDYREMDALVMIEKAASIDKDNKWYQMRLARFYKTMENYDGFITIYEQLLEKIPRDMEMTAELVEVLMMAEKYGEVLERLDQLEEELGVNDFISLQRIEVFKKQGKTKSVIAELEKLIENMPEEPKYLSMLAQIYNESGNTKETLKLYKKIKELDPTDPYISISMLEFYKNQGELDKAFEELLTVIRNKKLDINTKTGIYDYWFEKATPSDMLGKQAFEAGKAFIETYPDNKIGYLIMGAYYFSIKDYLNSKTYYEKVLESDSTNFYAWQEIVLCDLNLEDYKSMRQNADAALKFFPQQPVFYWFAGIGADEAGEKLETIKYFEQGRKFVTEKDKILAYDNYLAELYHAVGETEKSFQTYDRVLQNDPNSVYALNNYAYYLSLQSKDLEKALQMAARAVELQPENATFIDTYAWVYYKMGRYEDAERWLKKIIKNEAKEGLYYEHYGDVLYQMGQKQEAVKYWRTAKKIGSASELIEKKIKDGILYE
jgi:Tfp pilus assembly protein PilF